MPLIAGLSPRLFLLGSGLLSKSNLFARSCYYISDHTYNEEQPGE